jgi:excisionase family DNA binding protein
MNKLLYSRREVATLIGLSLASVEELTKSGQLPTVRIGRSIRIHVDALAEFAKTGTKNRTTQGKPLDPLWQGKKAQ